MALHPYEIDRGFQFDKTGSDRFTGAAAHELNLTDAGIKYRWRSITIKNGKAVLADDGEKIKGAFLYFDGAEGSERAIVRCQSAGTRFKNAGTTAIEYMAAIVGASRVIVPGVSIPERGFVQAASTIGNAFDEAQIQRAINGIGSVIDGGAANTAETDPPPDIVVQHGMSG